MRQRKKTVLVVEDDEEMLSLLRLMFRQHKLRLITAASGEQGLEVMRTLKPNLVLLDILMPGISGWEVYQYMKASSELDEIPIIIVSTRSMAVSRVYGESFDDVAGYVLKPFHPSSLVALVEQFLGPITETNRSDLPPS